MSYPSDLSDAQWEKIERFFERPDPRGARSKYSKRRVVEAILFAPHPIERVPRSDDLTGDDFASLATGMFRSLDGG